MLFALNDRRWKVSDFGLTIEGTSQHAHSTRDAMGTTSYRAPELLKEIPTYNNKVDVFGLGCTLFELATKKKYAHYNDYLSYLVANDYSHSQ